MKKYWVFISILFMTVGFATVSTTLSLNGDISVYNTLEDFDVYFSDIKVNEVQDFSPVVDERTLVFSPNLFNGSYILEYDVTNSSKNYDADVNITCTSGSSNVILKNDYDSSTFLEAHETRIGKLTVESRWIFNDVDNSGSITVGDEYTFENETFNVISQNSDTVTLLAKYNLGSDYRQSVNSNEMIFASNSGWEYTPGPKEIDIQKWSTDYIAKYVNEYVEYFQKENNDTTITGDLITLKQLEELECVIPENYFRNDYTTVHTCANSQYSSWLANGQYWWTRSAFTDAPNLVWFIYANGQIDANYYCVANGYFGSYSVRPTIIVSKDTLFNANIECSLEATPIENDVLGEEDVPNAVEKCEWVYTDSDSSGSITIGDEYAYCNEKFNVIDSSGENVKLLTKYYLGKNYKQSITFNPVLFSKSSGWEYYPGPKEIDLNTWSPNITTYINNYVKYLKDITGDSNISGDLITASQLVDLGCTINPDYSFSSDSGCLNSKHNSWLLIGQSWWTKSAYGYADLVIILYSAGVFGADNPTRNDVVVRPVITISKSTLNNT